LAIAIAKSQNDQEGMEKINILMVDDQPSKLLSYEVVLAELEENLIKANSADEALDCLLKNEIAIILTDVNMPGMDGFELADIVRQHPRFQDIAIIFVSGARMTDMDRMAGYEHGAVDYLSVPIVPELLRAKVRVFGDLYRKARELESLYSEMRRLSSRMIMAQDEERRRIARELHDSLGQQLTTAKIVVDSIRSGDSRAQAGEASELIDEALKQVRSISHLLHPPLLDEVGLEFALRWFLEGLTKRSGIQTSLNIEPEEFPRLDREYENAIYRIIQEALTNAFRHSGGKKVDVVLKKRDKDLFLSVRDNGKGIAREIAEFRPGSMGLGLGSMRQRVAELRGELKLLNANPGTLIEVRISTKAEQPDRSFAAVAPAK
jgi:signal transduction histidine kinase